MNKMYFFHTLRNCCSCSACFHSSPHEIIYFFRWWAEILLIIYFFRWWSSNTIAVVTGANRGIGFEIAHQLALHGLTVILTSRDAAVGEAAAKVLQEGGLNVVFHQLDIVDPPSIEAFVEWIKEIYGGIDILVKWPLLCTCKSNLLLYYSLTNSSVDLKLKTTD